MVTDSFIIVTTANQLLNISNCHCTIAIVLASTTN